MIRFGLLGSGSKGNALLVASSTCKILIDNGLSLKSAVQRALLMGETLDGLKAVFVTHEHSDHVNGLGVLARKTGVPVYMTQGTFESLPESVGKLPQVEFFEAGDSIAVDGLKLHSYSVSHDAADPVSFTVSAGGAKLGIAHDLGYAPNLVRTRLEGAHALVLESNYCPDMLTNGSYPVHLKQRIRSRHGHLSNDDMGALLGSLIHDGLRLVVLAHISQENNTPDRAHARAIRIVAGHRIEVFAALQNEPTRMFEVRP